MTNANEAASRYNAAVAAVRATHAPSSPAYADAMSAACREYEAAMNAAAAKGDKAAKKAARASVGPYLRSES